jgi:C1A family cysteine protease
MKSFIAVFFILILFAFELSAKPLDVPAIQQAIRDHGAGWTAAENSMTHLSQADRAKRLGLIKVEPWLSDEAHVLSLPRFDNLPDVFDWRDYNGNWVTPVRDQGSCGSCWAFSALGQVESWWIIKNNHPNTDLDLSEQFLLSCSDAGNCEDGGMVSSSFDFIRDNGIPLEKSLTYKAQSNIPCSSAAVGWEAQAVSIPGWGYITFGESQVENIKAALLYHPVSASFEVFSDFYSYHSGVYEHVFGDSEGWHAVLIVGWNDAEKSWIVKNSWGAGWGEQGYFHIKWGDSNFGLSNEFIWDEWAASSPSISQSVISASLVYGQADTLSFEISNTGTAPLQFYTMEGWSDEDEQDWLYIQNGAGLLPPGGKTTVTVIMDARAVEPGDYSRQLLISTNSTSKATPTLDCQLTVKYPDVDARVTSIQLPAGGFPLLTWSSIQAEINNFGLKVLGQFSAVCTISQGDEEIYSDTLSIQTLKAQQSLLCTFKPFKADKTGEMRVNVRVIGMSGDVNAFNDAMSAAASATNMVDDFENDGALWETRDGWGITTKLNGHIGSGAAHVFGGVFPYLNDMNTVLTYSPGFELTGVDTLFVTYWTRYFTADANDICFVEISSDSLSWQTVDSYSGVHQAWEQRVIDLTDAAQQRAKKAWFRFRFVSDASGVSIGVLLDEVQIFTHTVHLDGLGENTGITAPEADQAPVNYKPLVVNYPNPFNPSTTITYSLSAPAKTTLSIVNLRGQLVSRLVDTEQMPGEYSVIWTTGDLPSGVYFAVLSTTTEMGRHSIMRHKMLLVR